MNFVLIISKWKTKYNEKGKLHHENKETKDYKWEEDPTETTGSNDKLYSGYIA